jgi:SAM-dependent methyltransferase
LSDGYASRLQEEQARFNQDLDVHSLPPIFHYWSHTYLLPLLKPIGVSNPDQFFARYLQLSAQRCEETLPKFVSLGSGNCDTEVRVAELLLQSGLQDFEIHCVDVSTDMLARGKAFAQERGVEGCIRTIAADLNRWKPDERYCGIMANQSLHHMVELERLFDLVKAVLPRQGLFVVSDVIGMNGHQRWPEALKLVQQHWRQLPESYRYNLQLRRQEQRFLDWDCSVEGFEGVRAQDILSLLVERFQFEVFIGHSNVVCPFVDRAFGHHFDPQRDWDRAFIDRVHALDEAAIRGGSLTPTQMMAVMGHAPAVNPYLALGRTPAESIRRVSRADVWRQKWRRKWWEGSNAASRLFLATVQRWVPRWLRQRARRLVFKPKA